MKQVLSVFQLQVRSNTLISSYRNLNIKILCCSLAWKILAFLSLQMCHVAAAKMSSARIVDFAFFPDCRSFDSSCRLPDRQKASTKIREGSAGWCFCFCDSSVVAKWLYESYPQGVRAIEALMRLSLFKVKRKFFISNKELKRKQVGFNNCLEWFDGL